MVFKQFGYIVSFWLRREDFKKVPFRLFGGKLVRAEWIHVCIWLILCCPSEAIRTLFIFSVCLLSHFGCVQLFVTLWTVACQAPLSLEFSSQEYWSGLPCPPAGDLPDPGIKPTSLMSPALASRFFTTSTTWEVPFSAVLQHKTKRIKKKNSYQALNINFQFGQLLTIWTTFGEKKFLSNILSILIYPPKLILPVCLFLNIAKRNLHYGLLCVFCPTSSVHCPWRPSMNQ